MTVLSTVSAALSLVFRNMLITQINSVTVIPFLLPIMMGEGKSLNWTAEFSGAANAIPTAEGVALDSSDADDEDELPLTLPWSQFTKVASVTDLSQAAAASNYNPMSIAQKAMGQGGGDLLMGRVHRQTRRLALGIAEQVYAGDGTSAGSPPTVQLSGAALAIDSSTTLAGLAPATEAEWASHEDTASLLSISLQQIREFWTSVYDASGFYPEWGTCDSTIFDEIRGLYNDFEANVTREVSMARGGGAMGELPRVVTLEAGMRAVMIDQIPIILDRHATANTLYAWNSNFVEIQELPFDPVRSVLMRGEAGVVQLFRNMAKNDLLTLPRDSVEGMVQKSPGLSPFIKVLGDRGMSSEAVVAWFGQMCWKRRNGLGKLTYT